MRTSFIDSLKKFSLHSALRYAQSDFRKGCMFLSVKKDVCMVSTFIIKLIKRLHDERTNSEIIRSRLISVTSLEHLRIPQFSGE